MQVSYRLSSPAEAHEGLLLSVFVVVRAVSPHLPGEVCDVRMSMSIGTSTAVTLHRTQPHKLQTCLCEHSFKKLTNYFQVDPRENKSVKTTT